MSQSPLLSSICRSCRVRILNNKTPPIRAQFSNTSQYRLTNEEASKLFGDTISQSTRRRQPNASLAAILDSIPKKPSSQIQTLSEQAQIEAASRPASAVNPDEPYHINVFAHKHNIHVTFTEPSRDVILSLSSGQIGLKKSQRGTFDAAYQLSAYAIRKMAEKQWRQGGIATNAMKTLQDVRQIEVIMRGFGPGREAFQKVLLGNEGRLIRDRVVKVTDSTRLKFGGARSPAVRRLG